MLQDAVSLGLMWYVIFIFSTVLHEFAHAWTGNKLGDSTAAQYMTLNPLPHIQRSPFGLILLPILTFVMYYGDGHPWMLGFASVPASVYWARQNPRKMALMSIAGPLADLLLMIAGIALIVAIRKYTGYDPVREEGAQVSKFVIALGKFSWIFFYVNLIYGVFNLLPLPPLDGSRVLLFFLPRQYVSRYLEITWTQAAMFIGIIVAWKVFPAVFLPIFIFVLNIMDKIS